MNILIVGGAGFVGANLVRRCLREPGVRVAVLDSLEPKLRATKDTLRGILDQVHFIHGSMADEKVVAEAVAGQDVIFNCAAQTSHPLSIQEPLYDAGINCLGNLTLLEGIRRLNKKAVVVYVSSSTVIGKAQRDVVDEDHRERPLDIYSANKGAAEKYYLIYRQVHDLKTVVLRFANLYGPHGKGYPEFGFVNYFIDLAWKGRDIEIYGPGDQTRNMLYVEDAADLLFEAARSEKLLGGVFFASHDEHLTVAEAARRIVKVMGRGAVKHIEWPEMRRRIDIDKVNISSARLRALVAWRPRFSFEEGLLKTKQTLQEIPPR